MTQNKPVGGKMNKIKIINMYYFHQCSFSRTADFCKLSVEDLQLAETVEFY